MATRRAVSTTFSARRRIGGAPTASQSRYVASAGGAHESAIDVALESGEV